MIGKMQLAYAWGTTKANIANRANSGDTVTYGGIVFLVLSVSRDIWGVTLQLAETDASVAFDVTITTTTT